MKYSKFYFNSRKNKKAVDPFGFVDIVKVIHSNTLPATEADGANTYNGIDDPGSILGKPHDIFEAMHMQSAINDYKPDNNESEVK